MDPTYIEKVDRYYDNLVPVFAPYLRSNGGNIILRAIIAQCTEYPLLGIIGEARVNVLKVNLMLDGVLE